jgi:thioredoxin 2
MTPPFLFRSCPSCKATNRIPLEHRDKTPTCGRCGQAMAPADTLPHPLDITDASFGDEVLSSSLPVLLDCWAPGADPASQ